MHGLFAQAALPLLFAGILAGGLATGLALSVRAVAIVVAAVVGLAVGGDLVIDGPIGFMRWTEYAATRIIAHGPWLAGCVLGCLLCVVAFIIRRWLPRAA